MWPIADVQQPALHPGVCRLDLGVRTGGECDSKLIGRAQTRPEVCTVLFNVRGEQGDEDVAVEVNSAERGTSWP
jgi:hypothetical protein